MRTDDIIATILLRERYRRDRMSYLMRMIAATVGLLLLVVLGNLAAMGKEPIYRYLMTDATGRLIPLVPLERANMDDEAAARWAVDATTRTLTYDFRNYRRQFQQARNVLTESGWEGFQRLLNDSGNFVAVKENKYITTAVPNGPAKVLGSGPVSNAAGTAQRWGWTIEFPMLLTYRSDKQVTSQDLTVRVVVVRMPEFLNPQGLGIRQIVAR